MSFSFYVQTTEAPRFAGLDRWLWQRFGDRLEWGRNADEVPDPWPVYHFRHAYLFGVSTRDVEMGRFDDNSFRVQIMSGSCHEDYELGLVATELVAQMFGAPIEPEVGETCSHDTLREQFDAEWVNSEIEIIIPALLNSARRDPLTLPGAWRDFVIGDRVLAEFEGPDDTLTERLFDKIRAARYPDEKYFRASVWLLDERVSFARWGPGVDYVMPNVELVSLNADPPLFVPLEVVPEIAGDACQRLDERQVVIEAIDFDEWEALVRRAREFAVDPRR